METDQTTKNRRTDIPIKIFNGKEYRLYPGERYFSRGTKRLHVVVWEYYNGKIPKGYDSHHKDENPYNNEIENLEIIKTKIHQSYHARKRVEQNPEWFDQFQKLGIEAAKEWHKSKNGREWHSKQQKGTWTKRDSSKRTCIQCGNEYETRAMQATKFCSNNCKSAYRRSIKADNEKRICELCGLEFQVNKYARTRFCSKICAAKYRHNIRKKRLCI